MEDKELAKELVDRLNKMLDVRFEATPGFSLTDR